MKNLLLKASVTALFGASLFVATGCTSIKYIDITVNEGGRKVQAHKFFNDGLGETPANRAFWAAQEHDVPRAIQILKDDLAQHPDDAWNHYNLCVLYEAQGRMDLAEPEVREAVRLSQSKGHGPESRFTQELAFVEAHKAKR